MRKINADTVNPIQTSNTKFAKEIGLSYPIFNGNEK